MAGTIEKDRRFWYLLLGIAAAALLWRVGYLLWMRNYAVVDDGAGYHVTAIDVAKGLGFVNPLDRNLQYAQHPPGWILLLSLPSALGAQSLLAHQLTAAVVGTMTIVTLAVAGRSAFGRRVGLIAAVLAAFYANLWLYERELLSETLVFLGVAILVYLVYRFRRQPGLAGASILGALIGALALTRTELILVGPFIIVPLVIGRREFDWRQRIGWLVLAGTMCLLVMAPWFYYNSTRLERFVPVSAGLGSALAAGNSESTYRGDRMGYYDLEAWTGATQLPKDPSIAEGVYRDHALDFMGDHRGDIPKVAVARLGRTFGFYRPRQQIDLESSRLSEKWVYALAAIEYVLLVPLAVGGVVLARRRKIPVYPLLAPVLIVVLATAFTIGQPRYRAPAEIPLVLLAAVALEWISRRSNPFTRRTSQSPPQVATV